MRLALVLALLLAMVGLSTAQPPECYSSYPEIQDAIFLLQENHPDVVRVDTIGYSVRDHLPIYLVKVSDNVNVDEDEPSTLFIGHIHGEEILGIEATLAAMSIVADDPYPENRNRRLLMENYFIPTMNPEGLNVVFGIGDDLVHGADVSYRKNKRDNVGDGVFRYQIGWGQDSSGVDLNRNFDLHFYQGDTLFHYTTETERYDYYRGAYPFSEPEVQAVRQAYHDINPMLGATYHSSRQGGLSEKVFYPWDWGNDGIKMNPDQDVLDQIAEEMATLIPRYGTAGNYQFLRSSGRNGRLHDWAFAEGGWINYEVELGSPQMVQPDCDVMQQIVVNTLPSMFYLMDRAMGRFGVSPEAGYLQVHVTDDDGQPLVAEVLLPNRQNGYMKPRMTDALYGAIRHPLLSGTYTVITRKWGFAPDTLDAYVGTRGASNYDVTLHPLPRHHVTIRPFDGDTDDRIPATVVVHRDYGIDTLQVSSDAPGSFNWPEGHYKVDMWADGYIPKRFEFDLQEPTLLDAFLVQPDDVTDDDFETGLPERWTTGGDYNWQLTHLSYRTGDISLKSYDSADSAGWNVPTNSTGWTRVSYTIPAGAESVILAGWNKVELEPDYDYCYVEYCLDGDDGNWVALDTLNGYTEWKPFFYDFRDARTASTIDVRWRVVTDATDQDRGVFLDDIQFLTSGQYLQVQDDAAMPGKWDLDPVYPNPFNPSTTVRFEVAGRSHVRLAVYDILGREVLRLVDGTIEAGMHARSLDMSGHASGLYFIRLDAPGFHRVRKMMLMK